jgi:hypothetical protein
MRKGVLAAVGFAVLTALSLGSTPAQAIVLSAPAGLQAAADATAVTDKACWDCGGYYRPYRPYYGYRPYYRSYYGYGGGYGYRPYGYGYGYRPYYRPYGYGYGYRPHGYGYGYYRPAYVPPPWVSGPWGYSVSRYYY